MCWRRCRWRWWRSRRSSPARSRACSPPLIVFPIAAVVHASGIHVNLQVHWLVLRHARCRSPASRARRSGLTFGTIFDPRTVPLLFGIIILPLTFLGGTYYAWTTLAPVTIDGVHWLQIVVLVNPLDLHQRGLPRGAHVVRSHVACGPSTPSLLGFCALFLWAGTRNFRRRVIG